MALHAVQYTPITPRGGGLVHAVALSSPGRTACGRKFSGWIVALKPLTCPDCKRSVHFPVKADAKAVR